MLFRSNVGRRVMIVQKLLRFMKRQSQRLAHMPTGQFTCGEALQNKCFQQLARVRRFIQVELLGELVRNLNGNDHAELRCAEGPL